MALQTAADLIQAIRDSGLTVTVRPEEAVGLSAVQLARQLVQENRLTRWQAKELLNGNLRLCVRGFEIQDKLGEGGMGVVYKALQPGTNRTVALKVLSQQVLADESLVRRFFREAEAMAALDHPNIVQAHEIISEQSLHCLVMEHVDAYDISYWVRQFGQLPVGWSCECIRQAALAMQHAHERGLIHRDIKPSNLLVIGSVDQVPNVKLLDLGLARFEKDVHGELTELTATADILGTPDFMAPEQAMSTKHVDIRADVYSLGCTLYNMLTADVPFHGETALQVMVARATKDPTPVRELRGEVPP